MEKINKVDFSNLAITFLGICLVSKLKNVEGKGKKKKKREPYV